MSKKILHIVIGVIALLSASSKCYAAATPDSVVVFQFITKDETFWADYKENIVNFEKLANFVQQHRQQIMSGHQPVLVKGYCASLPTQELNMQIGKIRSNHVKSYVITHYGFKESMFRTTNFITPLGKLTDVVTISFVIKNQPAKTAQPSQQKQQTTSQTKTTTTAPKTTTAAQTTTPTQQGGAPTVIEPIVKQRIPNLHDKTEEEQSKTLAKQNFIPAPNTVPKIKEQSSFFHQPAIDKQQTTQQEQSFAPKSDELEPPQFYLGKTEIRTKKRKKDNQKQSATKPTEPTEPTEQKTVAITPAPEAKPTIEVKPSPEYAPIQEAKPVEQKQPVTQTPIQEAKPVEQKQPVTQTPIKEAKPVEQKQPVTQTPEKVEKKAEIIDKSTKTPAKEKQKADKKQPKKQKTKQSTKQPDLKIFETPDPTVAATIVVPSTTTEKPAKQTKAVKEKPAKQVKEKPAKAVKEKPAKQVKETPAIEAKEQKQAPDVESKAQVKTDSKPVESPKSDKNKITNNPVVIDLGLFQTEPVVKGTDVSTASAKENKPMKVSKEPKVKPTKVAKTPVVKEPKVKPMKVSKEPKVKPTKVAKTPVVKEPKVKPVKVAKEPRVKPTKVAKTPVVKEPRVKPVKVAKEPKVVVEKAPKVVVPRDPNVPLFSYELKTNLLYWALTAPNIEAEFIYNRKLSINIEGQWAHTDWDKQAKHFRIMQLSPEIRFYPVKTMPLYVGLYYNLGSYNFKFSDTGYQGDFQGAGISIGYKLPIAKRLSLEFGLAAGYLSSNIDTYSFEDRCNRYIDSYNRQYITPTKAKVSLVWRIGGAKK